MILLHDRIAERRLDAPEAEQRAALDVVVLFNAVKERGIFLRLLLALADAPVGDAAVKVLPDLFAEFRRFESLLRAENHTGKLYPGTT